MTTATSTGVRHPNVAAQAGDPDSLLSLYRRLLALRRTEPDLVSGAYRTLGAEDGVLRFARGESLSVAINLGAAPAAHGLPGVVLEGPSGSALGPGESVLVKAG